MHRVPLPIYPLELLPQIDQKALRRQYLRVLESSRSPLFPSLPGHRCGGPRTDSKARAKSRLHERCKTFHAVREHARVFSNGQAGGGRQQCARQVRCSCQPFPLETDLSKRQVWTVAHKMDGNVCDDPESRIMSTRKQVYC